MAEVLIEIFAQYFFQACGSLSDQSTVRFGSGAGPRFSRVWSILKQVLVTRVRPSMPIPPSEAVTQTGSPEKRSL